MVFSVSLGSEGARQESRKIANFLHTLILSISAICFYIIIKIFYLLTNFIGVDRERWQFSNILAYSQNLSVEMKFLWNLSMKFLKIFRCYTLSKQNLQNVANCIEFNIFLTLPNIYSKMVKYFFFKFNISFIFLLFEKNVRNSPKPGAKYHIPTSTHL